MGQSEEKKVEEELPDKSKQLPVVVVVDDEDILLDFYREALKEICKVYTFNNAIDALSFFSENKASLLVVDRSMPSMTGDELCNHLRSQPKTHKLPIIVISGKQKDIEEISEMMTKESIETYLTKPLDLNRFISNVQYYLKREKPDSSQEEKKDSSQEGQNFSTNYEL